MTILTRSRLRGIVLATVLSVAQAAGAVALEPLNEEKHINDSLRAAQIGDIIRKTCPTISARIVVAYTKAKELERYALDKGYGEAEIKAFVKNKAEKARIRTEAEVWLAEAGAVAGDAESYCRIGRDQIARQTLIGSLLRSSQ